MYRKDWESTDNIYENDVIRGKTQKDSMRGKSSELTESDSVMIRNYRAAVVCSVLLCVLLLTAVIVLCVIFMHEKQQLISKNEKLRSNNENLTNEREHLILKSTNLTNNRQSLRNELQNCDGWTYYQFSFYYMSSVTKSWTESKIYCTDKKADLVIINNRQEQDFVNNMTGAAIVYIGLTDSVNEGTWKWVDGSTLTSGPWSGGEPNGGPKENCAVNVRGGWADEPCDRDHQWICEKRISQLILP